MVEQLGESPGSRSLLQDKMPMVITVISIQSICP